MNNNTHNQSIEQAVLQTIKTGQTKMRPRWYFFLRVALLASGVLVALVIALYATSFILFALRENGAWFGPLFGSRGWFVLARSLPILLILFTLSFVVVLEILIRHFSFARREPIIYSTVAILLILGFGALIIFPFHRRFFLLSPNRNVPFVGLLYRDVRRSSVPELHRGVITTIVDDGFFLNDDPIEWKVILLPETKVISAGDLTVGDTVLVFGDQSGKMIRAYGIRVVDDARAVEVK